MKKQSIFLIAALLVSITTVSSQTTPLQQKKAKEVPKKVIVYREYDYLNDEEPVYNVKEKFGNRVGMKIINVNRKLVDFEEAVSQTSYNETQPDLLNTFAQAKLPGTTETSHGLSSGEKILFDPAFILMANIPEDLKKTLKKLSEDHQLTAKNIEDLQSLIRAYGENYQRLKETLNYHNSLLALQDICNKKLSEIISQVNKLTKDDFSGPAMEMNTTDRGKLLAGSDYEQNRTILETYMNERLSKMTEEASQLVNAFLPGNQATLQEKVDDLEKRINDSYQALKKISPQDSATGILFNAASVFAATFPLRKELLNLQGMYASLSFDKLRSDVDAFASNGKKDLLIAYNYFTEANYTYYVNPQSIGKDLLVMSVNIKPKVGVPCTPFARSYEVRVRSKGGVKIDFSTGLFINFGGHDFRDQTYRYDSVIGDPDKRIIRRNDSKSQIFPSIGALMHIYPRTGNNFNIGGCFGISTRDLDRINYHLGASFIFGYSQRFILSVGGTLTKANLISDEYRVDQTVNKADSPENIPTSSFNRFGWFVSFTYNLSSPN